MILPHVLDYVPPNIELAPGVRYLAHMCTDVRGLDSIEMKSMQVVSAPEFSALDIVVIYFRQKQPSS